MHSRAVSDETYVIDLCDEILTVPSLRQHRFEFLRGDPSPSRPEGVTLPVDAYYPELRLVIEYRERQHTESVSHFDKPGVLTVSACNRGEHRRIYDQRRRDLLPANGIQLLEIECVDLAHTSRRKLSRDRGHDIELLRTLLEPWTITSGGPNKRFQLTRHGVGYEEKS